MSGEPVIRDHFLLEDGGKLVLESAFQVGYLMLETSVISDLTSTVQLKKPVDFKRPDEI